MKDTEVTEEDYKHYLTEKHLKWKFFLIPMFC